MYREALILFHVVLMQCSYCKNVKKHCLPSASEHDFRDCPIGLNS